MIPLSLEFDQVHRLIRCGLAHEGFGEEQLGSVRLRDYRSLPSAASSEFSPLTTLLTYFDAFHCVRSVHRIVYYRRPKDSGSVKEDQLN